MAIKSYSVAEELTAPEIERGLIAAVSRDPTLYWEICDLLPAEAFVDYRRAWEALVGAIERDEPTPKFDWEPAKEPRAEAQKLSDLYQRRLLAALYQTHLQRLYDDAPVVELIAALEEGLTRVQQAVRELRAGCLLWVGDLIKVVLEEASERARRRRETGRPVLGLCSGLRALDRLMNGFNEGLYVLAGAPGAGKTSLALQIACEVGKEVPVLYVSFENPPKNLLLKILCRIAMISPSEVERGFGDLGRLRAAAGCLSRIQLAFLEGNRRLTVPQIRAKALMAMHHSRQERCLVVIDYLQRMAHGQGYQELRTSVSMLTLELRELSRRLNSPVLAISSQNRAGYAKQESRAFLETLKESGDIEYSSDIVLFLGEDEERRARPPARAMQLVVAKNRHGELGSIPLIFRADIGSFAEEVADVPGFTDERR